MRKLLLFGPVLAALLALPARAVDHNNIDAGRPLRFDDADAIAFREQALEFGLGLGLPRRSPLGLRLDAEYLYGFARNSHLSVGFEPSLGGRAGEESTAFDFGDVELGLFHNFNRQYGNTPAFSLRGDVFLPSGRDSRGVGFRLRGIASKQAGQYGTAHLNVDLNANPSAGRGEREFFPGVTLGYTRPLGYPTRFDTTGLAELSVQAGEKSGTGPVIGIGIGLRKQVTVRSVLDVGLQSDLIRVNGAPGDRMRFVVGYSTGF
jgi:hypothetical protein